MNNALDWLTEENWVKSGPLNEYDQPVTSYDDPNAVKFDLTTALRTSYYHEPDFWAALEKVKKAIKMLYPEIYMSIENNYYYKKEGKLVYVVPLYRLNDLLTFKQIKRVLWYL